MLTLLIAILLFFVFTKFKTMRDDSRMSLISVVVILILVELVTVQGYYSNLFSAPNELVEQKERLEVLEDEFENLLASDFSYVPENGDSPEKLQRLVSKYSTLESDISYCKSEIERDESRIDPNFTPNKIAKLLTDFGLTEKLILKR